MLASVAEGTFAAIRTRRLGASLAVADVDSLQYIHICLHTFNELTRWHLHEHSAQYLFFINDWVLRFIQSKHNIETGLRYTYYRILFDMLYASMLLRCQRDSCLYKKIWKSVRDKKKKADGNAGEIVQKQDLASIITKLTTYRLCLATGLRRACLGHSQIVNAIWAVVERRLANLRKHPYNVNVGHCHNKR